MKTSPYYSFTRGIALEDLWHDNDECEIGLSIALAERVAGTDHILKHCWMCAVLNQPVVRPKPKI